MLIFVQFRYFFIYFLRVQVRHCLRKYNEQVLFDYVDRSCWDESELVCIDDTLLYIFNFLMICIMFLLSLLYWKMKGFY